MSPLARPAVDQTVQKTSLRTRVPPSPHRSSLKWVSLVRIQLGRLGLTITMCCLLFPIYWLVQSSISTERELFHTPSYFFPPHPTFQGYIATWHLIGPDLLHSLIISCGVVVLDCALAVSAGYGLFLARVQKSAQLVSLLVLVGIVFPAILFVVPLNQLLYTLHLLNTYPGLILADSLYSTPLGVLLVYTYMLSIPQELTEAASVDGASLIRTLRSVVVPIATPGVAVTAIFAFLGAWGDYLFGETFTSGSTIVPASVAIANLSAANVTSAGPSWQEVMAGSVILALPVLLAIMFAQRYIRAGISAGAIKG